MSAKRIIEGLKQVADYAAGRRDPARAFAIVDGIRLDIELGKTGLWFGTSRDMKGLLLACDTMAEVIDTAPTAIRDLRAAGHP